MGFVDDPRHRYSYELRPEPRLAAAVRELAATLEADGLLPSGASTAPRFQPHLTLLRADRAEPALVEQLASRVGPQLRLSSVGSFGDGRIAWVAPEEADGLQEARTWLLSQLRAEQVDPLARSRTPWVPHLTVAYAIDEPNRARVADRIRAVLPLSGRWASVEAWDLDVRPTVRVVGAPIG